MIARPALLAAGLLLLAGCQGHERSAAAATEQAPAKTVTVTIASANGPHVFTVEVARTAAEQERGLMYRTDIPQNGGMLFAPYPPEGGPPREASFWMKNTPSPLDIIFIRADHTIARIAENASRSTKPRFLRESPSPRCSNSRAAALPPWASPRVTR